MSLIKYAFFHKTPLLLCVLQTSLATFPSQQGLPMHKNWEEFVIADYLIMQIFNIRTKITLRLELLLHMGKISQCKSITIFPSPSLRFVPISGTKLDPCPTY